MAYISVNENSYMGLMYKAWRVASKKSSNDIDLLIIALFIFACMFIRVAPFPSDDLLRDVIAGDYGYDYSKLYIYAPLLPHYNQYIGFDYILHFIAMHVGRIWTVRAVQVFSIIVYIAPLVLIFRKIFTHKPDKNLLTVFCLAMVLTSQVLTRMIDARPEFILASWVLFGVAVELYGNRTYKAIWVLCGILLTPIYWLAILYVPAVMVVFRKIGNKALVGVLLIIANALIWQHLSHGEWIHGFIWLHQVLANRIHGMTVGENQSIALMLVNYQSGAVITAISYLLIMHRKDIISLNIDSKCLYLVLVVFWFALSNMIRYVDVIMPLMVIALAYYYKDIQYPFDGLFKCLVYVISVYMLCAVGQLGHDVPKFTNIPANSKVLCAFDGSQYYVPFFSKNKIQIAPAMEIGANSQNIQYMVLQLNKYHQLDCKLLGQYNFGYIIEKDIDTMPICTTIVAIQGGYRLWKVNIHD